MNRAASVILTVLFCAAAGNCADDELVGSEFPGIFTIDWAGPGRAELCNLRGNVVVVDIFDPQVAQRGYKNNQIVRSIAADVIKFKDVANISYVLCTCELGRPQLERLFRENGIIFSAGVDPGALNNVTYGVGKWVQRHWVIVDHEGKIVFNGTAQSRMGTSSTEAKRVLDSALGAAPGVFGLPRAPLALRPLQEVIARGQFGTAEQMIPQQRRSRAGASAEGKAFLDAAEKGIADFRASRLNEIKDLAAGDGKWKAYKLAESYLRTFPRGKDRDEVRTLSGSLKSKDPVKAELEAREGFVRCAVFARSPVDRQRADAKAGFQALVDRFGETEFGGRAQEMLDKLPMK